MSAVMSSWDNLWECQLSCLAEMTCESQLLRPVPKKTHADLWQNLKSWSLCHFQEKISFPYFKYVCPNEDLLKRRSVDFSFIVQIKKRSYCSLEPRQHLICQVYLSNVKSLTFAIYLLTQTHIFLMTLPSEDHLN